MSAKYAAAETAASNPRIAKVIPDSAAPPAKAHPAVPGWSICSMRVPCAGDQRRAEGTWDGYGAIAERVSDELSGRKEVRGGLVRAALATGVCLPRLRARSAVEEPGAHLLVP